MSLGSLQPFQNRGLMVSNQKVAGLTPAGCTTIFRFRRLNCRLFQFVFGVRQRPPSPAHNSLRRPSTVPLFLTACVDVCALNNLTGLIFTPVFGFTLYRVGLFTPSLPIAEAASPQPEMRAAPAGTVGMISPKSSPRAFRGTKTTTCKLRNTGLFGKIRR